MNLILYLSNKQMEVVNFAIEDCNEDYDKFNNLLNDANEVWYKSFGNTYDEGECPSNKIIVGYNKDNKAVVSATILESSNGNTVLVSCLGAEPKNIGNGTKCMNYMIEYLKNNNKKEIYIHISCDENEEKLVKYYSKFGFTDDDSKMDFDYNEDVEIQKILVL